MIGLALFITAGAMLVIFTLGFIGMVLDADRRTDEHYGF